MTKPNISDSGAIKNDSIIDGALPDTGDIRQQYHDFLYKLVGDARDSGVNMPERTDQILDLISQTVSSYVIGADEEVPADIWNDPYPETYRNRNALRAEQRATLKRLLGKVSDE